MSCIKEQAEGQYECEVISDIQTWPSTAQSGSNSQLFYIAVEYVNSNDLNSPSLSETISQEPCSDFVVSHHINPLESNSECYPVEIQCQGGDDDYGGIIIQEFDSDENKESAKYVDYITAEQSAEDFSAGSSIKSEMLRKQENLELIPSIVMSQNDLQFTSSGVDQEVELLITEQTTDKLVSLNAQELLVENCLNNDQQLLIMPSLLGTESISLYPTGANVLENYIVTPVVPTENEEISNCDVKEKRPRRGNKNNKNVDEEVGLFSCVFSIEDKPILSRARASLPEFYLSLNKVMGEDAVLAKKLIPIRTQFGPLKGSISEVAEDVEKSFLINVDGKTQKIVLADESLTNWMAFVRRATTYEEQNLVVTQEEGGLYFTTVRNVSPKEELKVGYSLAYARHYNLEVLKPTDSKTWPCFECSEKFSTSKELQDHVDVHDVDNLRPRKRNKKPVVKSKKSQIEIVECNVCHAVLNGGIGYLALKRHIVDYHKSREVNIADHFTILKGYQCTVCNVRFKLEMLLNIHKLEHNLESPLDQPNHVCPQCQRKFPTRKQLVLHVSTHALPQTVPKSDSFKCHICYKAFAYSFRLQKHMLCHGSDDNKPLQCKVCKKRFLTKAALAFHVKIHKRGEKHFGCAICKERFDHVVKLRLHVPEHCDNNTYTCPHCSKKFSSYRFVRKHVRFHSAKTHHCPECAKSFTTTDNLKKHQLRHSDHKEFLCADCGKQFKRKDKLSDHIKKMHLLKTVSDGPVRKSGKVVEKALKEPLDFHRFIYKCSLCVIGFKRRGMLVNHLAKRHPDIRPDSVPELNLPILQAMKDYICQYCDKVYKSSSKRKQHVLKIHPGEPLPSDKGKWTAPPTSIQSSSFSGPGNVTTRPKNCQWCHRQYARRSKLLQHIRKAHPSKILDEQNEVLERGVTNTETYLEQPINPKEERISGIDYPLNPINQDYSSLAHKSKITTDGNITEITPMDALIEEAKYCHLSIEESEILSGGELMSSSAHLFQLMNANNGMLPHR